MLTVVALALAIFLIPSPWNWIVVVSAASVDVAETAVLVWWSSRRRSVVGVGDLVGRAAIVVTALAPEGQVRVQGEIWAARTTTPLERGTSVVVRRVDGLVLEVEPAASAAERS